MRPRIIAGSIGQAAELQPALASQVSSTLVSHAPVSIIDVSRAGCLLETQRPMATGTIGTLRLAIEGQTYVADVRVTRCVVLPGRGSTYRLGVEFLPTRAAFGPSLRRAVDRLVARAVPAPLRD